MACDWKAALSRAKAALMRRGRTEQDADDLLQEAWVRLAQYEISHPVEKPEAFLMRAALNLSVDMYRTTQSRGEQVLLEDVVLIDATPSAETVLLARERVGRLSVCIGRLSSKTRAILLMHRIEGLTYQEIGQELNLTVSSVEKHVAKALLLLTTCMEGW